MTKGIVYSEFRNLVVPVVLLILWAASELQSTLLTPWAVPYLIVLDLVILVGTAYFFTGIAERRTEVKVLNGSANFRIGFGMVALFLGAFVVRLALAALLFPNSLAFGSPPGGFPPTDQQTILAAIDVIFSFSVGLLVGRAIGIRRKVLEARLR